MKTKISKRILSALLAVTMLFVMTPLNVIATGDGEIATASEQTVTVDNYIEYIRLKQISGNSFDELDYGNAGNVAMPGGEDSDEFWKIFGTYNVVNQCLSIMQKTTAAVGTIDPVSKAVSTVINMFRVSYTQQTTVDLLAETYKSMQAGFDNISGEIQEAVESIIKEQNENTSALAQYFTTYTDWSKDKENLAEFYHSTQGNNRFGDEYKSYEGWKKELYDAYCNFLICYDRADNLDKAYDRLYTVAIENQDLYEYMKNDQSDFAENIQAVLYEYYLLDAANKQAYGEATYEEIIEKCTSYVMDWYTTFLFSEYCLTLCYEHQLQTIIDENPTCLNVEDPSSVLATKEYRGYMGASDGVPYSKIMGYLKDPSKRIVVINNEMAKYFARIYCLDESYMYESGAANDDWGQPEVYLIRYQEIFDSEVRNALPITKNFGNISSSDDEYMLINNKVSSGDILYMNPMPENDAFKDIFNYKNFYFKSSDEALATVDKNGIVHVVGAPIKGADNSFTISMMYNVTDDESKAFEVYSMEFEVSDREFSGGLGSEDCPYLLSSWDDINTLADESKYYNAQGVYFELMNDIDAKGGSFKGIPSFKGVFDGKGHSIHSFSMLDNVSKAEKNLGFFRTNDGMIKNLTIGKDEGLEEFDGHSVSIVSKANETSKDVDNIHSLGAIVGKNRGVIVCCSVNNVLVNGELRDTDNNASTFSNVGGVVGYNYLGVVEQCSVKSSTIKSYAPAKEDSGDNSYSTAGGIVANNYGTGAVNPETLQLADGVVRNCVSFNNKCIRADARGDGWGLNDAYPQAIVGGLVGDSRNGGVYDGAAYNNNLQVYGSKGGNTFPQTFKGLYIGTAKETFVNTAGIKTEIFNGELYYDYYNKLHGECHYTGVVWNPDNDIAVPIARWSGSDFSSTTNNTENENFSSVTDVSEFKNYLKSACWILEDNEENPVYPTLKVYSEETPLLNTSTFVNEYYQDELYFKYQDGDQVGTYPLATYRMDATAVGEDKGVITVFGRKNDSNVYYRWTVNVTVIPNTVKNVILYSTPAKMEYAVNDDFDCKGLKLLVEYANGDSEIISDGYEVVNDFSNEGETDVQVTYEGYDVFVSVMVMYALGDINRDGPVDSKDVMRLMRYLAGYDVDVVEAALDVNGDGFVNSKDTTHLMRYLAGWNVEIH